MTMSPKNGGAMADQQSSTGIGGGDNTAHLKGKLNNLYDTLRQL